MLGRICRVKRSKGTALMCTNFQIVIAEIEIHGKAIIGSVCEAEICDVADISVHAAAATNRIDVENSLAVLVP